MRRLTDRSKEIVFPDKAAFAWALIYEKLAAYEDSGLEPEEIKALKEYHDWDSEQDPEWMWKFAEMVESYKDGRLLILPYKVGDTVWSAEPFKDKKPREGSIVQIDIDEDGVCGFWVGFDPECIGAEFISEDIGKTVFFSYDEAVASMRTEENIE